MTDEELRLECLKLASSHLLPQQPGFGMIPDDEIVEAISSKADEYFSYIKSGNIPKSKVH